MTQADLARESGMAQNNISRLESPEYGKYSISSLKRIADALDVALVVRFVPFSRYIDWLSGTPRVDEGLSPSALAVPSFAMEEEKGLLQQSEFQVPTMSLEVQAHLSISSVDYQPFENVYFGVQPTQVLVRPQGLLNSLLPGNANSISHFSTGGLLAENPVPWQPVVACQPAN